MSYRTLVDVATTAAHLNDAQWMLVDCRHDLTNPDFGRDAYRDGHIPGARFLHLDTDLSGRMTGINGRHPLPDPLRLADRLRALGLSMDTQVVAYDDAGGMFAARLWWLLRWLGHDAVAVLDGGLHAWMDAMQPLDADLPAVPAPGNFTPRPTPPGQADTVDASYITAHLNHPGMLLIDARSPDRFRGENESLDPVGGHIPGALNRFFRDNLNTAGLFHPAPVLRTQFETLTGPYTPSAVVHQCGSGVTACHNLLAMEHAGLYGSRLYPGSWSEWCADPARPVARGAEA